MPYTVNGLAHQTVHYCSAVPSGDSSGYSFVARDGLGNVDGSLGIDKFYAGIQQLYKASETTVGTALIFERSGSIWLPVGDYITSATPGSSVPSISCSELVMTLRDIDFHKIRVMLQEPNGDVPSRTTAPDGFGANFDTFMEAYVLPAALVDGTPWLWVQGRSGLYIRGFVSAVIALNRKTRRNRGLA